MPPILSPAFDHYGMALDGVDPDGSGRGMVIACNAPVVAIVGIDGCKRGWVAVVLRDHQTPSAHFLSSIEAVDREVPDADVIGIDIPIGLPVHGTRQADRAAQAAVGPRRNSVFLTPVRAALEATTHAVATAIARELTGSGVSQQAFALRTKIFEVENWLTRASCPVYEVHPEVSFAVMCGRPSAATKKTWQGIIDRRDALAAHGIVLDHIDPRVGAVVGVDDVIDAAAAAWSARRALDGMASPLPDPPEIGESGQRIAIWA